jgi:hypothetical protein
VLLGWTAEALSPRVAILTTAALLPLLGTLAVAAVLRRREPALQGVTP